MPKKAVLLKSLTRGRIRSSFNKYNLFNIYKKSNPDFKTKSLYQQKWNAKQETRAYHGEYLTEGRWSTLFEPKLESVAQLDASLRGDGKVKDTPFLSQTYAVLEKRLDFALFRAMFASSVRQARQFILHGNVTVNGLKIRHPGYILKPGDMFYVRPDKVLEALGTRKPSLSEALKVDKTQIILWNKYVKEAKENPRKVWDNKLNKQKNLPETNPKKESITKFIEKYNTNMEKSEHDELKYCTPRNMLIKLLEVQASRKDDSVPLTKKDFENVVEKNTELCHDVYKCYDALEKSKEIPVEKLQGKSAKDLTILAENLLSFTPEMKEKLSDNSKVLIRSGVKQLSDLTKAYSESIRTFYETNKASSETNYIPFDPKWTNNLRYHEKVDFESIAEDEKLASESINLPWQKYVYGRQDPKKPYFTPWKPRQFLAPFAVLPHHLEISFKTCHAVYLRDPVARPGQSEVISPFDDTVHERAYMYYVRKGK
ncbi:similar to Saccharomyces cerevisiae YNL137C NAM9 Mitochondrial ribosomal component of the small subunit [Maudiozyma barnettii]|uniref:Small ribosomal subunit protein uS4m n=1 Tax=Maudiozyma barnettii TaxID=61262 RepID=A0A8H2VBP1_9SACH|nr:mitochondrial 37S ribosomal protein NAM9 [Kazachstania barnettii]CAB4252301.1 similar to Saccharomyces cerevisiae YNL137C NAM9 Mitochondrial ribosomal component of the small subunit [Kazachstania barnettii]CAD1779021.1 similar to Saccharomyces cerevisiae YNL137C NAM9 Mitochondrial ribosomal component of the small subunit [Kazachstania barnettii]